MWQLQSENRYVKSVHGYVCVSQLCELTSSTNQQQIISTALFGFNFWFVPSIACYFSNAGARGGQLLADLTGHDDAGEEADHTFGH